MSHICRSSVVPSEGHETRRDGLGQDETELLARLLASSPTPSHAVSATTWWIATSSANAPTDAGVSRDRRHAHGTPKTSASWPRSRNPLDPFGQQLPRPAELSRRGNVRLHHARPDDEAHGPVSVLDHAPGDLE